MQKTLTDIVNKHIMSAEVHRAQSHEVTFLLPIATTPKFAGKKTNQTVVGM
jgi:hypothetical protein